MLINEQNQIKTSSKEISDILQNQFTSVFSDPSKSDISAASFEPPQVSVRGKFLRKREFYHLVNLEGSEHQPLTINFQESRNCDSSFRISNETTS